MPHRRPRYERLLGFLGVESEGVSHREALLSTVGGCLAIAAILLVCRAFVGPNEAGLLVASMGASAVLLFAVPHGPLSQPWAVLGGHLVSAVVGVTCSLLVDDRMMAAALAVGVAIGTMQVLRCVHPPGGATSLSAVVSGPAVHALGYRYVVTPVLVNAVIVITVAIGFHALVGRRKYPAYFGERAPLAADGRDARDEVDDADGAEDETAPAV